MNFRQKRKSQESNKSPGTKERKLSQIEFTKSCMKHNFKDIRQQIKAKSTLQKYTYDKFHQKIINNSFTR